jgi:indolepyruvate ferredoxin oxidoreductase beta subunit
MKILIKEVNIIICGVGGQGVVLMSELLGNAAVKDGISVIGSEVLGMAQRGGSVFSNLRLGGDGQLACLTPEGKCDILLAVEPSEALRNIQYLNKDSVVVINSIKVIPYTVHLGKSRYPDIETILKKIMEITKRVVALDASNIALKAGSLQTANVVMLGALYGTGLMNISAETAKAVIREHFPQKTAELNINAFDMGFEEAQKSLSSI